MPDVLKQTLQWNSALLTDFFDSGGTGATLSAFTYGESKDSNDLTASIVEGADDNVSNINTDAEALVYTVMPTATTTGGISFVRVRIRAKRNSSSNSRGEVQAVYLESNAGATHSLTTSYTWHETDFTTDPINGGAWTNAKVNNKTWGFWLHGWSVDNAFATTSQVYVSEFQVQLYGPDAQISTPSSVIATLVLGASLMLPGALISSCTSKSITASVSSPTVIISPNVVTPDSLAIYSQASLLSALLEKSNPTTPQIKDAYIDSGISPVTIRSYKASLSDQSVVTKDVHTSTGSGTQLQPLYGTASQGLQGNAINGTGTISGIKLFAIVRISKVSTGTISNVRFGTAMGNKSLETSATINDYSAGLTDSMWETVNSTLITTGQNGNPFTWGNGTDSFWASLFGWTFNYTYGGTGTKQLEVAEAWIEVYTETGINVAPITITRRSANIVKSVRVSQNIGDF